MEKEKGSGEAEDGIVEIDPAEEGVNEPAKDEVVRFDLNEILGRIDEMHASMMPMEDDQPIAIPTLEPAGIPVTLQSVEALEREAESARAMAEFSRSILSGTQMRLTDLLDMGQNTNTAAKKPARKRVEPSQQLRLF